MSASGDQIEAVRRFNRFYTSFIGALSDHFLGTNYSLTPMRVLYQIGAAGDAPPVAAEVARDIGLDKAQVSRAVAELEAGGLLKRVKERENARRQLLSLTAAGRKLFLKNVKAQQEQIAHYLDGLAEEERARLVQAMADIQSALGEGSLTRAVIIRPIAPGDMGWVTAAQTRLYASEYGWNGEYETLVLKIFAEFAARQPNPVEAGWVAEADGIPVGAVFVMQKSEKVAQLRLLHVAASARGLGIGGKLVDQCLTFAKQAGYGRIELWTNDVLVAARKIYQAKGFTLIKEERHRSFGAKLNGQYWGREL